MTRPLCLSSRPLHFFDSAEVGRIVNRFLGDVPVIDSRLANALTSFSTTLLRALSIFVALFLVTPYALLAMVIITQCTFLPRNFTGGAAATCAG